MIGILVATKNEAYFFLRYLTPVKKEGIYHYRGAIDGKKIALYLTRPGIAAKEQLRRFLRLYSWQKIISTGACANLTSALKQRDVVRIGTAKAISKPTLFIPHGEYTVVSAPVLVTDDSTKADIYRRTQADVLDMETYAIAAILSESEFNKIPWCAVRVVDDTPGEEKYLYKERMLREMTVRTLSGRLKWRDIWAFGLWDYFRITTRRHRIAKAIFTVSICEGRRRPNLSKISRF
ncbi:MAG TPA: hypothetical protein PLY93_00025 [Turneriella sp.]|nr:hypothetical protein [Turneriella sp.]